MPKIIHTPHELSTISRTLHREGKRVAIVPTMGNLHEGHLTLVRIACEKADAVIVSIFVNPTQFGPNEDLAKYPRTFAEDMEKLKATVTKPLIVYHPKPDAMYASDHSTWVEETVLSLPLCGASRPGHFRGVTTVVAKLFNAAQPDVAVFGQKDAQQAWVIQRMIRDLNYPIEFILGPIVREKDGLAMSSRNRFLSDDERQRATTIHAALQEIEEKFSAAELTDAASAIKLIRERITAAGGDVDYVETVDPDTMQCAEMLAKGVLIAVAARFGTTRLLDNVIL